MTEETNIVEKQEAAPLEGTEHTRDCPCFVPQTDIYETDQEVVVVADMPGVDAESVDITLERNVLSINGFAGMERPEGYSLVWAEYRDGDYQRQFTLTDQIDRDGIEAVMKDGVLRLRLPKASVAKTRKIAVKAD